MISENWSEMIKASKVELEANDVKKNYGKVVIQPLERGWGITIGNALRRVLLSSIRGSAITSVRVEGVIHEYDSIPGVREDMMDFILNLKEIGIAMDTVGKKKLTLRAEGPCVVTAGMIEEITGIEIINKDHIICHINEGHNLFSEFTVESGKGYVPASESDNTLVDSSIGIIPIDSIFSPIKKVSFKVENSRVGQVTDYDCLVMEVSTDGSLDPATAVSIAARILQEQLESFIGFEEEYAAPEKIEETLTFDKNLFKKIDELELSVRSQNCLKNDNIVYIGDLVKKTEGEMLKTPNFGRKSLNEIKEVLSNMGLRFGMEIEDWPPGNIEEVAKKLENPY